MGYFAVLNERDPTWRISEFHINYWCMSFFGLYYSLCDVGIQFNVDEGSLSHIDVALPFEPARGLDPIDLHDALTLEREAVLVFGEPVAIDQRRDETTIRLVDRPEARALTLRRLAPNGLDNPHSTRRNPWVVRLTLANPVASGPSSSYLRVRFVIGYSSACWTWKRGAFGLGRAGAVVDIRVNDVREAAEGSFAEKDVMDIPRLNALVVAPDDLQVKNASPSLRYMRRLEGEAWVAYLYSRRPHVRKRRQSIVYHWQAPSTAPSKPIEQGRQGTRPEDRHQEETHGEISRVKPFRGFLDLGRRSGFMPISMQLVVVSAALMLFVVAAHLVELNRIAASIGVATGWFMDLPVVAKVLTAGVSGTALFLGRVTFSALKRWRRLITWYDRTLIGVSQVYYAVVLTAGKWVRKKL